MKKLLSVCLVISMFFNIPMTTLAVEAENLSIQEMDAIQQELDSVLAEFNKMATEEKMAELLAKESSVMEEKVATIKEQNDLRRQFLEKRLESLGVNTIDPDNPDDMAALEEVMLGNSGASARSISDPPNLESFADCYSLRQYTDNVTINGTNYEYSYIYVTDDKNYSGSRLTQSQSNCKLIGKESTVLKDILDYQFSFGLSSFLGVVPGGWLADWTIGTVFTAMESYNENSTISYSGNEDIYTMTMLSVTQMMYVYVYLPNSGDWELCGTRAPNISFARAESLVANVSGTAVSYATDYPTVFSRTGSAAYTYVQTYILNWLYEIDYIGSFTVNTYDGGSVRFTPGFAAYPLHLI